MMNIAVDFLICMFEVYIFYDFLHDILEKRTENKILISIVLGVMPVVMCGINCFQVSQINLFGTVLLFYLEHFFCLMEM